jgi:hypothetical protein
MNIFKIDTFLKRDLKLGLLMLKREVLGNLQYINEVALYQILINYNQINFRILQQFQLEAAIVNYHHVQPTTD